MIGAMPEKEMLVQNEDKKYPYAEAYAIALDVLSQLEPHCIRAEIAGSIRRKKPMAGDIEIVAIPKPYSMGGLFDDNGIATVVNKWEKVRGDMEYGKTRYTQRILPSGIALDLFFAQEDNWGMTFALRTGSADYSYKVLASTWVSMGYKSVEGYLMRDGKQYPIREEIDLFNLLNLRYVEPEKRNL